MILNPTIYKKKTVKIFGAYLSKSFHEHSFSKILYILFLKPFFI